jgi:hypothetical protein
MLMLGLFIAIRIAALGRSAGFATHETGESQLRGQSMRVVLVGKAIHYVEGLVYGYLPLDLFSTWPGMTVGAGVAAALLIALLIGQRGIDRNRSRSRQRWILAAAVGWVLLFSLHASSVPDPRTLYIPTLGPALMISCLAASAWFRGDRRRSAGVSIGLMILALYIGMHIQLNHSVTERFAPTSRLGTANAAERLASGELSPEARSYAEAQLHYLKQDELLKDTAEEVRPWRVFVKDLFRRAFQHGG